MAGYSKKDLDAVYYTGFVDGVKMCSEYILDSVSREIENKTIKIDYGTDRLFSIINKFYETGLN